VESSPAWRRARYLRDLSMSRRQREPLTRAQTIAALRELARSQGTVTTAWLHDHARHLLNAAIRHFGGLSAARAKAGIAAPPRARKWSQARVIQHLRAIHRDGGSTKVPDLLAAGRYDLAVAAQHYLGGIRRARRLARIPEPRRRRGEREPWDELRVVLEILDLISAGKSVALSKVPAKLVAAGMRFFGSWQHAIEAAGLDYGQVRLVRAPYTRDELIQLLRRLARERPTMTWGQLHEHRAWVAFQREFGGVKQAVAAARIVGWPHARHQKWDQTRVLYELRSHPEYRVKALPNGLRDACVAYFGGVRAARAAAGLEPLRTTWSEERIVAELQARAERGDHALDRNLKAACERYFGSVLAARRAAKATKPPLWTRERVIATLKERAAKGELAISGKLADACSRYFGSIPEARRAAGVALPSRGRWRDLYAQTEEASLPDSFILDALRGRAAGGNALRTSTIDHKLATLARKRFGSLKAALSAAGLEAAPRQRATRASGRVAPQRRRRPRRVS